MPSTPTPPSIAIAEPHQLSAAARSVLVRPFSRVELEPPPSDTTSGLFPAVDQAPTPTDHRVVQLRRAVLLIVVVGAVVLLGYATWQRAVHTRTPTPTVAPAR